MKDCPGAVDGLYVLISSVNTSLQSQNLMNFFSKIIITTATEIITIIIVMEVNYLQRKKKKFTNMVFSHENSTSV